MRSKKAAGDRDDVEAWESEVAAAGGLFRRALHLIDRTSDPNLVVQTRLMLAYCYLEAGQLYEAGIVAHAVARWKPPDFVIDLSENDAADNSKPKPAKPATAGEAILAAENQAAGGGARGRGIGADGDSRRPALEATSLALAAFVKAHDTLPVDKRDAGFHQIVELALLFESNFPKHERVDPIRLYVGYLHEKRDDRVAAAEWYARVSWQSPDCARARLQAGQTLWSRYLVASTKFSSRFPISPGNS